MNDSALSDACVDSATALREWLAWPGEPFAWQECDSPIENDFFHDLHKYASDQLSLVTQQSVHTDTGSYRLDFLLRHRTTGRAIGIECDGKSYHSVLRDSERDKSIMQTGLVAEIYRIAGKDLYYSSLDVLQLIAQREPWIVSDRFHVHAEMIPFPGTYHDEGVEGLDGDYNGIMRTYFDYDDDVQEMNIECGCEHDCDCRYKRKMVRSQKRTPTLIRFMSGPGHPSPFFVPEYLKPLPMPEWKLELARQYNECLEARE
jgi:very-short-patch-repair endonuclease